MAASTQVRVHRIDDQRVIQICRDVMEILAEHDPQGNLQIIPGVDKPIDENLDDAEYAGKYAFPSARVNAQLSANERFSLSYSRTILGNDGKQIPSALYNEFKCDFSGGNQQDWGRHSDKLIKIQEVLGAVDIPPVGGAEVGQEGALRELLIGFGAQHRSMLQSLNEAIKAAEDRREALDEENASKAAEQRKAHEDALEELETKRSELERQSHMAERRRLLRELTEATGHRVKKSIAPPGAIWARWGVFMTSLLISGCTAWLAISSFSALGSPQFSGESMVPRERDEALDWIILVRAVVSSIIAVGALIYAASWLRGFYNSDLAAAQEIERFTYDLNRASWVIETVLEVQQEEKGKVPEAWVEGVTRGLFDDRRKDSSDDAAKALSALLGYTASASFGPDGPQFDVNRRGARKLSKAASGEGDS